MRSRRVGIAMSVIVMCLACAACDVAPTNVPKDDANNPPNQDASLGGVTAEDGRLTAHRPTDENDFFETWTMDQGRLIVSTLRADPDRVEKIEPYSTVADSYIKTASPGETVYAETRLANSTLRVAAWSQGEYGVWAETYATDENQAPKKAIVVFRVDTMKLVAVLGMKDDGTFERAPDPALIELVQKHHPHVKIVEAENISERE